MIIDHRTYVTQHGRLQEFIDRYEKMALGVQQHYLERLVGYFVTDIGPLNQVVHLWRTTASTTAMTGGRAWKRTLPGRPSRRPMPGPSRARRTRS